VCETLFASAVDVLASRLGVVSLIGSAKGWETLVVAFFGSSRAFETLAAEPLSAASPVTGGASGVAIVVASGASALVETCEFSVAPLSLTADTAYTLK
jgi:hypothetical protein